MSELDHIPVNFADAVQTLATWHGEAGEDNLRIYAAENIGDDVVRLILRH